MMTQQMFLLAAGCVLVFIGGIVTGVVAGARRTDRYRRECNDAQDELDEASAECSSLRKKHAALIEEYRNVYDSYNVIRKRAAQMEQELHELSQERAAERSLVSNYEKAAFDYNARVERISMLQKENQVLSMQVAVQRKRISELEMLREQVSGYREAVAYANACSVKIRQLQSEVTRLKRDVAPPRPTGKTVNFKAITQNGTLATVCNRILEASSKCSSIVGGVIADDMGFPIVSTSELTDELSGISVLHQYCSSILEKNIGFGNISRITFKNTGNMLCTIMPFLVNGQPVFYAGLSRTAVPVKPVTAPVTEAMLIR